MFTFMLLRCGNVKALRVCQRFGMSELASIQSAQIQGHDEEFRMHVAPNVHIAFS